MMCMFRKAHIWLISVMFLLCGGAQAQQLDFLQQKNSAGKASLTSDAYYVSFTLGTANFSPELRLPVQIFYDSSVKDPGLLGVGWRIPQLESSAVPRENGALWTTPWGEKVFFYSRKDTSREVLNLFNEKERENAYFSPYADWTANGRPDSGTWTIFGRRDMRGWKFSYIDAKLRRIDAPSGQSVEFFYSGGKPTAVRQRGRDFITLSYSGDKKSLSEISINGIAHKVDFSDVNVQILPETLSGKEVFVKSFALGKVWRGTLNPLEFSYNSTGYLSRVRRGEYIDEIYPEHETLAQRKAFLSKVEAARKAKRNPAFLPREAVSGRILSDRNFTYSYPTGRVGSVALKNRLGQSALHSFDAVRGIATHTDFSGKTFSTYYFMRYDVAYNGKVRQIVDGRKRVLASYRYDKDSGKITRYRDKAKNDINFKYDTRGNLVLISKRGAEDANPLPLRSFQYAKNNPYPVKINELDHRGNAVKTTSVKYDNELRPILIDDGRNNLKISYNFYGYPAKIVDTFGRETSFEYDSFNRKLAAVSDGVKRSASFDENGLLSRYSSELSGALLSFADFSYDQNGALSSYKDQDGLEKKYGRDELGRICREIFPDSTEVCYSYDELGRLSKVVDQNSHEINFSWNRHGLDFRKTAVGQLSQNLYDEYGRLAGVESKFEDGPAQRSISYSYDEFDRLSEVSYGPKEKESFKYDTWGRVVEKSRNGLVTKFKYDHFGRLVEKREGESLTKYAYDNYGKRLSRVTTRGKDVLDEYNTYDKFGRLVKTVSCGKAVEYAYDDKNRLAKQTIDGNCVLFEYTKLGQLASKTLQDKSGKTLSELKYFYAPNGRVSFANGRMQEYKYDAKSQLLAVIDLSDKKPVEEYVYDASGNILKKTVNGKTTTYTYDASNQLVSSTNPEGDITNYAYDAAGRLIKEGEKSYEYGWLDKVVRVAENGKELARFEYHNNNQLAKAIRESGVETFEWDGLALIERNGTKYINEPHPGGGNPVLAIGGKTTEAIFTDMLGTSLGTTNNETYTAITKTSFGADTSNNSSFFTGKPYVEDLGYAFLFRNYRADMGKWLSQDLIGYPDGWNNFAYCENKFPIAVDRYGLYFTYSSSDTIIISAIEKIRKSDYGKDPNSSFYKMDNDSVNGVYIESSNMPSKFSPSVNDYGQTYINLNSNEGNNSNYVVRDKNGNVFSGNVSPESILIHEIQHAYDNSRLSTDEYNRQATPGSGQTGEDSFFTRIH